MMQTRPTTSGININSKHYIDQLESSIIQIAKCLSVEKALPVDPDTKEMTRQIVQQKLNTLLPDDLIKTLKDININAITAIKASKDPTVRILATDIEKLLSVMELNNV